MMILSRFGEGGNEEVGEDRRAKFFSSTLSPSTSSNLTIELRSPQNAILNQYKYLSNWFNHYSATKV